MKKKILITGASGFIGSFLVEEALRKGYEVYAGVRHSSSREFLQQKELRFFELDFSSPQKLKNQLSEFRQNEGGFAYIVHNAGITQAKKLEDFYTVNYGFTKNLADAAIASAQPLEKFVLISSLASYGPGNAEHMRPIDVKDDFKPLSAYGKSKAKATEYVHSLPGLPHLVVYPTGVYGPRDKGFFQFIKLVNKGLEPYVGRHRQSLSLVYVKDLARAVIGLTASEHVNQSYLVSDGKAYDKEQIGIEARRTLKRKTLKIKLPLPLVRTAVKGMDGMYKIFLNRLPFINREKLIEITSANWLCNSEAVWTDLAETPAYDLQKGIEETIGWYKEQKWL
ncbi:NAD-dependent epimerase/dehydratase family protein [Flavisolibacter ginsenosidimutans]|uniref:NAD(P)-dependent oxidoreductase n=1 Tax=Flavisolibacter ginsenosidimutans TaxID=661481 RepID=A0A5B8UI08_9BACT|nr:NAD(P)-dependent oxidoreductase [Flavisolibacter ginsenosidimutans]QEC56062.1 NAD(P)-dependent oxidoreductase [Flavisolibacter ginsenosidimutans]